MKERMKAVALRVGRTLWQPFAMAGYRFRRYRRNRARYPRLWRTDAQIVALDLEYIPDDEKPKFDKEFFADLVKRRDRMSEEIGKLMLVGLSIFLVQVAFLTELQLDTSIFGFKVTNKPGVPEVLLVASTTLSFRTVQLQAKYDALNAAVMWGLSHLYPESFKRIGEIAFDGNSLGKYFPINLPHMTFRNLHLIMGGAAIVLFTVIAIIALSAILYVNYLIFANIWDLSKLGVWSKLACIYSILAIAGGTLFTLSTRFRMPYTDNWKLHYFEMVRQFNPNHHQEEMEKEYKDDLADTKAMLDRGYTVRL